MPPSLLMVGPARRAIAATPVSGGEGGVQDAVVFPDDKFELILGPQVSFGSTSIPWPNFDIKTGEQIDRWRLVYGSPVQWVGTGGTGYLPPFSTEEFGGPDHLKDEYYYDAGRELYMHAYRTGDSADLADARWQTDRWYETLTYEYDYQVGAVPRVLALGGLMCRAMDGKPEYWDKITEWLDGHWYWIQIPLDDFPGMSDADKVGYVYQGVRDGAYITQYNVWMSHCHPDADMRALCFARATSSVYDYYLKNKFPGKSWYWQDTDPQFPPYPIWANQPFHVGLLHDALIDYHRLYGGTDIITALKESAADLYDNYYRVDEPVYETLSPPVLQPGDYDWRANPYFDYPGATPVPPGGWPAEQSTVGFGTFEDARETFGDTNVVAEARQANNEPMGTYGYLYALGEGDEWRTRGDELAASTFGFGAGPGADALGCLMEYNRKSLNQVWRNAGKYMYWRQV